MACDKLQCKLVVKSIDLHCRMIGYWLGVLTDRYIYLIRAACTSVVLFTPVTLCIYVRVSAG
jgi:hypothetical protein